MDIRHPWMFGMITVAVVMTSLIGTLAILDHIGLRTQLHDLGHMEQSVWQITQGRFSMPLSHPVLGQSRLVTHTNLIFYVLAPFYAVFRTPIFFLVLAAMSIGVAGIFLFFLARRVLGSGCLAFIFGSALLLNPFVQETALYDFHPHVLAIPLLVSVLLFLEYRAWWGYWIAITLLLFIKEDMSFLVLFLAPFVWTFSRKHAVITVGVSVGYWIAISAAIHLFFDTAVAEHMFFRFAYLGETPMQALLTLVSEPWRIFDVILSHQKGEYLGYLFAQMPLAFVSPVLVFAALPNLFQNLLDSTGFQARLTGVYYSGVLVTVILCASVYGLQLLRTRWPRYAPWALGYFVSQAVIISFLISPIPYGKGTVWKDYAVHHDRAALKELLDLIPPDASVATQNNLGAHLAAREVVVEGTAYLEHVDYVLFAPFVPYWRLSVPYLYLPHMSLGKDLLSYSRDVGHILEDSEFGLLASRPPFYLFKRGYSRTLNAEAESSIIRDLENIRFSGDGINEAFRK